MAIDDQAVEATTSTATDTPAPTSEPTFTRDDMPPDPKQADQEGNRRSIKDTLRAEFDKAKKEPSPARQEAAARRAREEQTGKFAPDKGQVSAKVEQPVKAAPEATPSLGQQATSEPAKVAPQGAAAAPASLSKDTRAIWDTLPEVVRNDILKRESDTTKGVEQLKQRYQPIDEALAPYRSLLQQAGKTDADAVKQLFAWHQALAGPNKAQAFEALARSHNYDLSTLAPGNAGQPQQDPNDPRIQLQQALHGTVSPLDQRLSALEQQLVRQQQGQLNDEIGAFSKDKPHFDRVRYAMGQMMASGYASSLEDAYNKAIWADPEVRGEIQSAEQAKREADAQAAQEAQAAKAAQAEADRKQKEREALDKARRANVSPRGSSPMGSIVPKAQGGKSVRASIAEARQQVSGGSI